MVGGWLAGQVPIWAAAISGTLVFVALAAPGLLLPINRIWAWLGHYIGLAFNHVLLSLFYYSVIVPFGGFGRLFDKTDLMKRPDPDRESYWAPVGRKATPETYADMF
jgi:hypothetical protein